MTASLRILSSKADSNTWGELHKEWTEAGVSGGAMMFHRGDQGGASNQPGVAKKSSLFQYKNVVDYKVLDYFSA